MKKICFIFIILGLFIFIGCGGSESEDCTTIDGYTWSPKSSSEMSWNDAVSYCDNLTVCRYFDWHLPTISELRTLVKNCYATETGGSCSVSDSCLSSECRTYSCFGCDNDISVGYSKLGDTGWFWSSFIISDYTDQVWCVNFSDGHVGYSLNKTTLNNVRCVRNAD